MTENLASIAANDQDPTDDLDQASDDQVINDEELTQTDDQFEEGSNINQDAVNRRINKITFEKHEALRKSETLEEENRRLKELLEASKVSQEEIVIPEVPDAFDPNYAAKVAERDEAIRKKTEQEVSKKLNAKTKQESAEAIAQRQVEKIQTDITRMFNDGKKLGIEEADMRKADTMVSTFVRDPSLAQFILGQENSALLVKHLSENISELENIAGMNPMQAAVHISTKVLPKISTSIPRRSSAPDPLDELPRRKVDVKDPYLKGVAFE